MGRGLEITPHVITAAELDSVHYNRRPFPNLVILTEYRADGSSHSIHFMWETNAAQSVND